MFVVGMSFMRPDVREALRRNRARIGVWDLDFGELMYAADASVVVDTEEQAEVALALIA